MDDITVTDLAVRLKDGHGPTIIDVREPDEYAFAHIDGSVLKPLDDIMGWLQDLDRAREYALLCHTGSRSGYATAILRQMGFKAARNVIGGIDAWSVYVDPKIPRY